MKAKGGICVTGDVIVLGVGVAEGQVTVTGDAFVGEYPTRADLAVRRKLHVFGSTHIQHDHQTLVTELAGASGAACWWLAGAESWGTPAVWLPFKMCSCMVWGEWG